MSQGFTKNFAYGEIWESQAPYTPGGRRELVDPRAYTNNSAFLDFLRANGYRVFLDHGYQAYAHTDVTHKEIVLNGNYSDTILSTFLQHELGHLMLFDVNQFVTVGHQTLRSVLAKVIYTPQHLVKYGIEQLLFAENIAQDVIIETTSNGRCVCSTLLSERGENAGVKHLGQLESAKLIAEEVCKTVLKPRDENQNPPHPDLPSLLENMLKGLSDDLKEIKAKIESEGKSDGYHHAADSRREMEKRKLRTHLDKLGRQEKRRGLSERQAVMRDRLEDELRKASSPEREESDDAKAEANREKSVAAWERKLERSEELKRQLEEELRKAKEALEAAEKAANESEAGEGEGEDPGDGSGQDGDGSPGGPPAHNEVSPELHANHTDHLSEDFESTGGHSFDCGMPHPITVTRDESRRNEAALLTLNTRANVKKVELMEEDVNMTLSNRNKIAQNELTYFKANKKEFTESDMLQGKRRLRASGVNVLIGLDISGSMTQEWGSMFTELSVLIESLRDKLDIEEVVYFTYNSRLQEHSKNLKDLRIVAGGGNAFAHVYQQMMTTLPIMMKNEIILVTDCGDNLGFKLTDSCEVNRNGEPVVNHVSIIDTENAGFYDKTGFDPDGWSLHRADDKSILEDIQANVERLIER